MFIDPPRPDVLFPFGPEPDFDDEDE